MRYCTDFSEYLMNNEVIESSAQLNHTDSIVKQDMEKQNVIDGRNFSDYQHHDRYQRQFYDQRAPATE